MAESSHSRLSYMAAITITDNIQSGTIEHGSWRIVCRVSITWIDTIVFVGVYAYRFDTAFYGQQCRWSRRPYAHFSACHDSHSV